MALEVVVVLNAALGACGRCVVLSAAAVGGVVRWRVEIGIAGRVAAAAAHSQDRGAVAEEVV